MKILRVFPRKTNATPRDELVRFSGPGLFFEEEEFDEVHVSVAFTWDIEEGERLAHEWDAVAPGRVKLGGPAFGGRSGDFVSGMYLSKGYTITSRGCPNNCWFCRVQKAEGNIRELPIVEGWNVLDDNILATSDRHFKSVCDMLKRQKQQAQFTGGLDAELLSDFHINQLSTITPRPVCFFAFDPGDRLDVLKDASERMLSAGWMTRSGRPAHSLRCYVLIGYPKDSVSGAIGRLESMLAIGFTPMAMLWRNPKTGRPHSRNWYGIQKQWARPMLIHKK